MVKKTTKTIIIGSLSHSRLKTTRSTTKIGSPWEFLDGIREKQRKRFVFNSSETYKSKSKSKSKRKPHLNKMSQERKLDMLGSVIAAIAETGITLA